MALNNNQNESALPTPNNRKKQSIDFIPKFFRTEANRKFLQGTLDQLISSGTAEKIDGYVGKKYNESYKPGDNYIQDVSKQRNDYQFEPSVIHKDNLENIDFVKDYKDYVNMIKYFGGNIDNHDMLNTVNSYSWTPHINWDAFTNFREYYWLPNGPLSVPVKGQSREVTSTYTVTLEDQGDNTAYVFNDGFTRNPKLKLYRGQTYKFDIDTPGHPIAFAISRSFTPGVALLVAGQEGIRTDGLFDSALYGNEYDIGEYVVLPENASINIEADENVSTLYPDGIRKFDDSGSEVAVAYVEKGTIEFTIPFNAPDRLFYISQNNINTSGQIRIYDIEDNTYLNVEQDVLGKKYYKSSNNVEFTNGMCVRFQGDIYPEKYTSGDWYIEGVGSQITLVSKQDLTITSAYTTDVDVPFDSQEFDVFPFASANNFPLQKDYITINRASKDKNPWSRNNRWFHKDVILKSFEYNNISENLDDNFRAARPIIEFDAGLKLYNFGVSSKKDVDLIDTVTTDVFSNVQGKIGYIVDGIELQQGMRVLFAADQDNLVYGKIYKINFITLNNERVIQLTEADDATPLDLETVFVTQGNKNAGNTFHFHENSWILAQQKIQTNQPPLFDLCCPQGNSYTDTTVFDSTTFKGTKLFSYKEGSGVIDPELGFALSYRNIDNSGDILFEFNLLTDSFSIQNEDNLITVKTDTANLRKYKDRETFSYVNGWSSNPTRFKQYVIRDIEVTSTNKNNFNIDVYKDPAKLTDLKVIVFKNNKILLENKDYTLERNNNNLYLNFPTDLISGDLVKIKTHSKEPKNNNGYYEIPISLERNPLNEDIKEFTLGEVFDHVSSMIEDLGDFDGIYPGNSNLRDIKDISKFGKRFVKHDAGLANTIYHFTSKDYNIIKALKYAKSKYNEFKRNFVDTATKLGFDGPTNIHVEKILQELNKDKSKTQPFYFSDMLAYSASTRNEFRVIDKNINFYPLTTAFNLKDLSEKSVYVYLNGIQLIHSRDYIFNDDGFIDITVEKNNGDIIEVFEYLSTDGSFIPPTPSKLGMYPTWYPHITLDDTSATKETVYTAGPFKIYAEMESGSNKNKAGWFYPVFTSKNSALEFSQTNSGTGEIEEVWFKGLNTKFYMPVGLSSYATSDTYEYDVYPNGTPFIVGHDGSQVLCYQDYRDNLILDLEKRIYNNIKIDYDSNDIDVYNFIGNDFIGYSVPQKIQNNLLLRDFTQWQTFVQLDYSSNSLYDLNNPFTFNYSTSNTVNGSTSPGFWRKIYFNIFNTDKPHSHPWHLLGFNNKPTWWEEVYGPAPYTSNNLILWKDLETGKIADPSNTRIDQRYSRPGLTNFIPVDEKGNLISPLESNTIRNFNQRTTSKSFAFGDYSPVEAAWRKSSDFPFAIINAMLLSNPADTFAKAYDLANTNLNLASQKIYNVSGKFLENKDIKFPNTIDDNTRNLTSGLVNYIYNLLASDILKAYTDYTDEVKNLEVKLSFKLAGFSDKNKLNLVLESKSPKHDIGTSGIFVPQENYSLVYNTSSPVENFVYSGILVEKTSGGFKISGYNQTQPILKYFKPLVGASKYTVSVGGISEQFIEWSEQKAFKKGQVVFYLNTYYRATSDFTSSSTFDQSFLSKLSVLPTVGGRSAEFHKNFDETKVNELAYGSVLETIQDVVSFLLGYGKYLETLGFIFDDVADEVVNDWSSVAKEFMFWTTQGWASGTVISLSPSANSLRFKSDYAVVDNIFDNFYDYSIVSNTGDLLERDFTSLLRDDNTFGIALKETDLGLYGANLPLVQKEHVIVIDNNTIFNDVIYIPASGYRQKRIRVTGYRSDSWNGGLNIPGFIYDDAKVTDFEEYKDYSIGSLIKYKQYYYVAKENVIGSSEINFNQWSKLSEKPESDLLTNFDYRIGQFTDFYEPNTSSFDSSLQELSERFLGFQKRNYLSNLIVDDVSQLKFYQGMIQEKGTQNSITKLFGALGSKGEESIDFFEEWAIKTGMYGSFEDIEQIELSLTDKDMIESPQSILFTDTIPNKNFDKIYRVRPVDLIDKPSDYTSDVFTVKNNPTEYVKTSGYVDLNDIDFETSSEDDLALGNVNVFALGGYLHITNQINDDWTVFQHENLNLTAISLDESTALDPEGDLVYTLELNKWLSSYVEIGDFIGIRGAEEYNLNGFYKIKNIVNNFAYIKVPVENTIVGFSDEVLAVSTLRKVRLNSPAQINDIVNEKIYKDQKIWVDNYDDNNWAVLKNSKVYNLLDQYENPSEWDSTTQNFTGNIVATDDNNNVFVAASGDESGKIFVYRRSKETAKLQLTQVIDLSDANTIMDSYEKFGYTIDVSEDGEYLIAGVPHASGVKTLFKGDFDPNTVYKKSDIVKYRESFWKANKSIVPQIDTQPYSTFDSYVNLANQENADSTTLTLLLSGNFGLPTSNIDHILVRAPLDMYLGTTGRTDNLEGTGDRVNLYWNRRSYAYPTLDEYLPFDGKIPSITPEFLSTEHEIVEKIDAVLFVDTFVSLPAAGDQIETDTGSGIVHYISSYRDSAVIYLKDVNGVLPVTDEIYVSSTKNFIGFYTQESTFATSDAVGGYWYIETPFTYSNNGIYSDTGRGLVYADVKPSDSDRVLNLYSNIQDTVSVIGNFVNEENRASFITHLSYRGDPEGVEEPQPSNLWVVRIGKDFTNNIIDNNFFVSKGNLNNEFLNFNLYDLDNSPVTIEGTGFTIDYLNQQHQIYDLWDGYIDFEFTEFDFEGNPFGLTVGDIIEDVQFPRDGQGGLALTSTTTSSAEVVFYQRKFNNVRVYVKVLSGTWQQSSNIGRFQIRRTARDEQDVDRIIGSIDDIKNSIILGTNNVGKLLVFQKLDSDFDIVETPEILDAEYYFYRENIENGISRLPNPPTSLNKDYSQVYNILGDYRGLSSGYTNEGAVVIFRRQPNGSYDYDKLLTSQYKADNRQFGDQVKIKKQDNLYTLLVGSKGDLDPGTRFDPGSIEIFYHGTDQDEKLKGTYQLTQYEAGDIVIYKDNYYVANKNLNEANGTTINNTVNWNNISWRYGTDPSYKGEWDNTYGYQQGSIILKDNQFYTAKTNIAADVEFLDSFWEPTTGQIDYLGYLPNLTGNAYYNESVFDPETNILEFSDKFDVSKNGQVLAVVARLQKSDSTTEKSVVIYRKEDTKYKLYQVIPSPDNITDWGSEISIKPDGLQIAISAPKTTINVLNQGAVYIYKQNNSNFELYQTIVSPTNELSELFGYKVALTDENLVITSLNGDQKNPTLFDSGETTFDLNFTQFANTSIDSGMVYVYENIKQTYTYSEKFKFDNTTYEFGKNLLANNNHVYVGIPFYAENDSKGIFLDYRKPKGVYAWNTYKEISPPVDLNLIEGAFIYNKKENKIVSYVDYIDPIQGKIAGVAEQDITFKTFYDPAYYNVGSLIADNVDITQTWLDENVGKVWWDLSTARFVYPYQGSINYQKNNWNLLSEGSSIDVYEWVESNILPSQWTTKADTEDGIKNGISGQPLYGDSKYSAKLVYDERSQTFTTKYYFWVKNKKSVPSNKNRNLSAYDIAQLIARPRENGYRFISFVGNNKIILNNFDNIISSNDIVLNIKYKNKPTLESNLHKQYKLIADGDANSKIPVDIERKWYDSLIGFDTNYKNVPDSSLSVSRMYGVLNNPRQSMFINRIEALKQLIERTNLTFKTHLISDDYDISNLNKIDDIPSEKENEYDNIIDTYDELQYVSTSKIIQAVLQPIVINGKLVRVNIINQGRGYKVPPTFEIRGTGTGAVVELEIDNLGKVTTATVKSQGQGYDDTTSIFVRRFSILVRSDKTSQNYWTIYGYNETTKTWFRRKSQSYDVTKYWNYIDWYADGYSQFTQIDYEIDASYQLQQLNPEYGSIVKIKDVGGAGWLLLERVGLSSSEDYTIDYNTIGRQNGTIELSSSLYNAVDNISGYDNRSFDNGIYDNTPAIELRIILETIRDSIFVNQLETEYNQLFFSSLRYIMAEQKNVDWLFKSSFIKINHKLGNLTQDVTFDQDNKSYFEDYVKEVKPYKTTIREFVSTVDTIQPTNSSITDFDLSPAYSKIAGSILPISTQVIDGVIRTSDTESIQNYPRKHFFDNLGFQIDEIVIKDSGSGYVLPPKVIIGDGTTDATAQAFIGYGKVTSIKVTSPGNGFITPPKITIEGSQTENGTPATAFARLTKGVVRTPTVKIKFDRVSGEFNLENLDVTENFVATNIDVTYDLEWPMNTSIDKVKVFVNDQEQLKSKYTYENVEKTENGFTYRHGRITFSSPFNELSNVRVEYYKSIDLLDAADRINFAYNPTGNMFGKKLNQLMSGVDYGGVEVKSFDFGGPSGWDSQPWFTDSWDSYENTFEDEIFVSDGSTIAVQLTEPLENGVVYNLYKNGVRIDDSNYDINQASNPYAIVNSITGDGQTTVINTQDLGIELNDGDIFVIRKITSDGSITPDLASYDTALEGGDLGYTTAQGINAEEIVTDGDLFISPTHGKTEEFIPGTVFDTLDIKVYTKESGGQGTIYCSNIETRIDGDFVYKLQKLPGSESSILVKYDGNILDNSQYTVDWTNQTVVVPVTKNKQLSIIVQEQSTNSTIKYIDEIVVVNPQSEFILDEDWNENKTIFVTINGNNVEYTFYNQDDKIAFRLESDATEGDIINYAVFNDNSQINYSQVVTDEFLGTGVKQNFELKGTPFYARPTEHNVIVQVGQKILNSGYSINHIIPQSSQREYPLESFQQPPGSLSAQGLKVFLNGEEIFTPDQWRLDIANSSIVLSDEYGIPGDSVEIYNISESEYQILGNQLSLNIAPAVDEKIYVYQYSNHNLKDIEKSQYDVVKRATLISDEEKRTHLRLTAGEIELRKPAIDAQYVWVTKNNELLIPSVDYFITDTRDKVRLVELPLNDDVIEVIHFTAEATVDGFSYRQFKDILNRTHFKRLDAHSTSLSQDLMYNDLRIEVLDGSDLPEPDKGNNLPGIIFINGERIEYFVKEGNTLRQIRRGTLGTGTPVVHATNTKVYNQNKETTIPYRDTNIVYNITSNGIDSSYDINFDVTDKNEIEVFVAGRRLRKTSIATFDPTKAQNSPDGDIILQPEFEVFNNKLILNDIPKDQTRITIIKKQGQLWKKDEETLATAQNSIARFLRAGTYEQPE